MTGLMEQFDSNRRRLLMDRSSPGRMGTTLAPLDVPEQELPDDSELRSELDFPELAESELVRYFAQLSQFNFSIDHNFYPLGSCTMKYNPKLNDQIASLPGLTQIHPLQPDEQVQGALKLLYELQGYLTEITGLAGTSLAPMAGADAELAGMLMIRAYHHERGETGRKNVLIPDSAHGTNPASAAMAGFEVVDLPSDDEGNTDLDALKASVGDDLAGLMITLPSTLGLFDSNILDVVRIVHEAGGLVYGDGANLNALLGKAKFGSLGFDVIHSNLHKTFTQPHGGGGPGAGPVIAGPTLVDYLPEPVIGRSVEADGSERVLERQARQVDRPDGRVPRQLRRPRTGLLVHRDPGQGGDHPGQRRRGRKRELHPERASGLLRPALRPNLHARGGLLRTEHEQGPPRQCSRRVEAADRLRDTPSYDVLPSDRRPGAHD